MTGPVSADPAREEIEALANTSFAKAYRISKDDLQRGRDLLQRLRDPASAIRGLKER